MKKFLAVLLTLVMAFTMVAPAYAIDLEGVNSAVGEFVTEEAENGGIFAFVKKFVTAFHELMHGFVKMFGFRCPFCGKVIKEANPANVADTLADAKSGDVVVLVAGEYEPITLGELDGVIIEAEEGAAVDKFVTTADTVLKDVTIKGFDFEVAAVNRDCGLHIDGAAVIENLVIEDSTFTGSNHKSSCGIFGNNSAATLTVKNCTFSDMGYAFWSVSGDGYAALTIEGCTFTNLNSWVVLVQYGFLGDLTIDGCTFTTCVDGISKNGSFAADKTFTFTNNTVAADCAGHDGKDSKWFELSTASAVIEGNTFAGAEWIPGAAQGLKTLVA